MLWWSGAPPLTTMFIYLPSQEACARQMQPVCGIKRICNTTGSLQCIRVAQADRVPGPLIRTAGGMQNLNSKRPVALPTELRFSI